MPKAVIDFSDHTDRIVNVVKARDGLRSKSEAIAKIVEDYEEYILDPALKPDFALNLQEIRAGKFRPIDDLDELL